MIPSSKNDHHIIIKKCSCFHWRQLVPIIKEALPEISENKTLSWYLRTYKKTTCVALLHNNIVGFYIYEYDKNPYIAWLYFIGVKKENRGCGIGRTLLESFMTKTKHGGCSEFKLHAFKDNTPAISFYEKHGFKKLRETEKRYIFYQKTNNLNKESNHLKKTRRSSLNFLNKIYLKVVYFILVDLF